MTSRQLDVNGQIERWLEEGILETEVDASAILESLGRRRPLARPDDPQAGRAARARGVLHVRCGPCHRPGGNGGPSPMDLTLDASLSEMKVCGAAPIGEYPTLPGVSLVEPGRPERSLLHLRMVEVGALAMPPGRRTPDREGAEVVRDWIASLAACS